MDPYFDFVESKKVTGNALWNMKLFEERTVHNGDRWIVVRVPGGWIMREGNSPVPSYVFVPLNNEFVSLVEEAKEPQF